MDSPDSDMRYLSAAEIPTAGTYDFTKTCQTHFLARMTLPTPLTPTGLALGYRTDVSTAKKWVLTILIV